ncbi:MAG: hypothetical protein ABEJ22_05765, partial [Haloferacaceae archaeon]
MNHHALLDRAAVAASSLLVGDRTFFAESVESDPLADASEASSVPAFSFDRGGLRRVAVETPAGTLDAAYLGWQWRGPDYPTVVYHHGSNEDPFDFGRFARQTFGDVFVAAPERVPANVVAVRAPFHGESVWSYAARMTRMADFVSMLAGSTALVEAVVDAVADDSVGVVVSGFSLGGWATNLHRAVYGTADVYAPMFAGAALHELFLSSAYRRVVDPAARSRPGAVRRALDFESVYETADGGRVSALLGRYDQYVEFDRQRRCYADADLAATPKGHVTGALAARRLREHVLGALALA